MIQGNDVESESTPGSLSDRSALKLAPSSLPETNRHPFDVTLLRAFFEPMETLQIDLWNFAPGK